MPKPFLSLLGGAIYSQKTRSIAGAGEVVVGVDLFRREKSRHRLHENSSDASFHVRQFDYLLAAYGHRILLGKPGLVQLIDNTLSHFEIAKYGNQVMLRIENSQRGV